MRSGVIDAVREAQFSHAPVWIGVQWWWLTRVEWRWEPDQPSGTLTGEFLSEQAERERRVLNDIVDVERFTTEGRTGWRFITERERRRAMERTIEWAHPDLRHHQVAGRRTTASAPHARGR